MYYRQQPKRRSENGGVKMLHDASTGDVAGYRISGVNAGPTALATGFRDTVAPAFHQLARLPSLPRLHGQIILAFTDQIEVPGCGFSGRDLFSERIDGSIFLAFHATRNTAPKDLRNAHREAYWSVLRLCTQLGMISGRGVPPLSRQASDGSKKLTAVR